jgi:hypothetical protein
MANRFVPQVYNGKPHHHYHGRYLTRAMTAGDTNVSGLVIGTTIETADNEQKRDAYRNAMISLTLSSPASSAVPLVNNNNNNNDDPPLFPSSTQQHQWQVHISPPAFAPSSSSSLICRPPIPQTSVGY